MINTRPVWHLTRDGQTTVTVVVPPDGSHDRAARRIAEAIKIRCGALPFIQPAARPAAKVRTPHVIALGCLADNAFIEALYFRWHTLVDRWYPGIGGWAIQTLFSPLQPGNHVLLLGGSDAPGVERAVDQFIARLGTFPSTNIPWCGEVRLGEHHLALPEDRIDVLGTSPSKISIPENALPEEPYTPGFHGGSVRDHLLRLGMYGPHADNFHLCRSAQFGLRYLYSGQSADADRYRETLLAEVRTGVLRKLYHYKSLRMLQLWSVFGSSSIFSEDESTEVTRTIQDYLCKESGIASRAELEADGNDWNIFNRHTACDALNLWVGADWLWRHTGETEWLEKRAWADAYFETQSGVDVPLTGLTEGYGSYLEVYLEWMLLSRPDQVAAHPHIRRWAERVISLCTNTGELVRGPQTDEARYPYNLLRKLAYVLDDGRYLFVANLRERRVRQGMDRVTQFSAGQAYAGDVEAREPNAGGWSVTPLNERLRKWQAPAVDPGKGFDRAFTRSGWHVDDDYLMVIGMRSGAKALPNVGSLAAYERFGQRLITSDSVPLYPACASPWRYSTVCIDVGGLGPGMFAGAEILTNRQTSGGHLFSFQMTSPGMCRWIRTLLWQSSAFVLIVDHVLVERDDECALGINWRCGGRIKSQTDHLATLDFAADAELRFYVQIDGRQKLTAETHDYPALGMPAGTPPNRETMLHARAYQPGGGKSVKTATLLHATRETSGPRFQLVTTDEGWSVAGAGQTVGLNATSEEGEFDITACASSGGPPHSPVPDKTRSSTLTVKSSQRLPIRWSRELDAELTIWAQSENGSAWAVGLANGKVILLDASGKQVWTASCDTEITAIIFCDGGLIVGCSSGKIYRLDPQGQVRWCRQCHFRPERTFWPYWFLPTPLIAALAAGHDENRRRDLIVAGTGSTNLIFLDAETGEAQEDVVSPYGLPDRIRAYRRAGTGELRFLVGHSRLSCGSTLRAWSPLAREEMRYEKSVAPMGRTMDGWDSCGVVDFHTGPLDRDRADRVVVLRHGAVNQLTVYDEATGNPLWDATLGGDPVALAVVPGESGGESRCYVADKFGGLIGFDSCGKRVLQERFTPKLEGMLPGPKGHLVLWNAEELHLLKNERHVGSFLLRGQPLGIFGPRQKPNFMCSDSSRLVLHEINWQAQHEVPRKPLPNGSTKPPDIRLFPPPPIAPCY